MRKSQKKRSSENQGIENKMGGMDAQLKSLPPIFTAGLFPALEAKLIELLRSLAPDDWEKQTLAPKWKVKDIAAHLLDTQTRGLAAARRGYKPENSKKLTPDKLLSLINTLNAEGVRAYGKLGNEELISRMEAASKELADYVQAIDPFAPAVFPVSWAGEEESPNWFHTAREFTERWHHQQQICVAVNKPGIMTREFYFPVLDCFMRALPYSYRNVESKSGSLAQFNISGECGGSWYLLRESDAWKLIALPVGESISETTIPQEIAWRIFTKGIAREEARSHVQVAGDEAVGLHILTMISIVG
ncbi:MAG TPA: maleylpyruvate isomerase N-terminal domain-containing protein [Candidatus Acidoferrales bacterium]|nr:maleylpyruvate isomerase N-terminal domain-containing protein [Candidatus Acidoferrales bacterium]